MGPIYVTAQPVHLNLIPAITIFNLNTTYKTMVTFTLYDIRSGAIILSLNYTNYFRFASRGKKNKRKIIVSIQRL